MQCNCELSGFITLAHHCEVDINVRYISWIVVDDSRLHIQTSSWQCIITISTLNQNIDQLPAFKVVFAFVCDVIKNRDTN